jgi:hypothetical protein
MPAEILKVDAASLIVAKLINQTNEIKGFFHKITMLKKSKKHPKDMTDQEAAEHLFHPRIVQAVHEHLSNPPKRRSVSKTKPKVKKRAS